tara:strand:+ start:901 stop:1323 length:423 start_codon:yes stop_codon:yes gene_type:complete
MLLIDFAICSYIPSSSPRNDYSSDESGNVYMYINVIGHVKNPGTYLIYEGADVLTILSAAGGPKSGAKLGDIMVYRKGDNMTSLNMDSYMNNGQEVKFDFRPNDTIYLEETFGSYLLSKSTILNTILTMLNIYFTIEKNK